jgi:hypothetical protein
MNRSSPLLSFRSVRWLISHSVSSNGIQFWRASLVAQMNTNPKPLCLVFLLTTFVSVCVAADGGTAQPGCGSADVKFKVETGSGSEEHRATGKARLYVVEAFRRPIFEFRNPTIRIGLDGHWLGATNINHFLASTIDPGEHRICVQWQTTQSALSRKVKTAAFVAVAGGEYYFRVGIGYPGGLTVENTTVQEGRRLIGKSKLALSSPEK